jgi:catechol 2,3-dioxygenase-like lactoylglutathione lyase family enzyme
MNPEKKVDFKIDFLDHVAIRVKDMEASARWYEEVLGLKRYEPARWRPFPTFLLAGKTGVALFPANMEDQPLDASSKHIKIDHFAFQLSPADFAKAQVHYTQLGIVYHFQDHHYFHSLYTKDPDGHTVELTTLVVEEGDFY